MARALLVNPPSGFMIDDLVYPPLGLLRVAEANDTPVVDLAGRSNWRVTLSQAIAEHHPDVVGVGATTPQMPVVAKIAAAVREISPRSALVIGGAHVTMCFTESKRAEPARKWLLETFDAVVAGDGEHAMAEVVAGARGLVRADRRSDAGFSRHGDIATGRHRIDLARYRYAIDGRPATSLVSQLGCPFNCGFCGGRNSQSYRLVRRRSVATVIAELEGLYREYGYTAFMFFDDELNVNREMVPLMHAISDLQARLGVDFRLRGHVKAELFTDEQARAMKRAGFSWLLSGFEAANDRILRNIKKVATSDDNTRVIEIATRHGIKVKALMSIGHPGENEESVLDLEEWLLDARPAEFDVSLITPYPGSPYYDASRWNGKHWTYVVNGDALHSANMDYLVDEPFYKGVPGEYRSFVWTDYFTADELAHYRDMIEANVRLELNHSWPAKHVAQIEKTMGATVV